MWTRSRANRRFGRLEFDDDLNLLFTTFSVERVGVSFNDYPHTAVVEVGDKVQVSGNIRFTTEGTT